MRDEKGEFAMKNIFVYGTLMSGQSANEMLTCLVRNTIS